MFSIGVLAPIIALLALLLAYLKTNIFHKKLHN